MVLGGAKKFMTKRAEKLTFLRLSDIGLSSMSFLNALGIAVWFTTLGFFEGTQSIQAGVQNVLYNQLKPADRTDDNAESAEQGWRIYLWVAASVVAAACIAIIVLYFTARSKLRQSRALYKDARSARKAKDMATLQTLLQGTQATKAKAANAYAGLMNHYYAILGLLILNVALVSVALFAFGTCGLTTAIANDGNDNATDDLKDTHDARAFYTALVVGLVTLAVAHLVMLVLTIFILMKAKGAVMEAQNVVAAPTYAAAYSMEEQEIITESGVDANALGMTDAIVDTGATGEAQFTWDGVAQSLHADAQRRSAPFRVGQPSGKFD